MLKNIQYDDFIGRWTDESRRRSSPRSIERNCVSSKNTDLVSRRRLRRYRRRCRSSALLPPADSSSAWPCPRRGACRGSAVTRCWQAGPDSSLYRRWVSSAASRSARRRRCSGCSRTRSSSRPWSSRRSSLRYRSSTTRRRRRRRSSSSSSTSRRRLGNRSRAATRRRSETTDCSSPRRRHSACYRW